MIMKVLKLDHIHVYCEDVEKSTVFYIENFDASELMRNENVHSQPRVFLSLGESVLVLSPFPPGISPTSPPAPGDGAYSNGFGVSHFGLRVADIEEAVAQLVDQGIEILGQPISEPTGLTYAYFAAPDGVVVELTQYGSRKE